MREGIVELMKILSKKNNYLALSYLAKFEKVHFRKIKRELNIEGKSLYRALEELVKAGLVQKEVEEPAKRTSKVFYSLTELGKKAIKVYDYIEELEKERKSMISVENSSNVIISIGDNNKNVIKNVNIKK